MIASRPVHSTLHGPAACDGWSFRYLKETRGTRFLDRARRPDPFVAARVPGPRARLRGRRRLLRARLEFGAWFPGARNNAVPSWLLIAAGLTLSAVAVARARRRVVSILLLLSNLFVAGAFASLIYVSFAVPEAHGPAIGTAAADFALADQTGKVVRLADFAGKPLLLVFYRGHW
jgi:hypothetical protein